MSRREEVARLAKLLGLELDVESYLKAVEECAKRMAGGAELRRRNADWAYIESRPEPLRTALKLLVETGDLWYSSKLSGVPLDELNEERKRARIPLVVA